MKIWCHKGLKVFFFAGVGEDGLVNKIIYSNYPGGSIDAIGKDRAYRHEIKEERPTIKFVFEEL
jgi:hypothetical protein